MTAGSMETRRGPLDHRIPPPVLALATAIAMVVTARLTPALAVPNGLRFGVAGLLGLLAGIIGASAFTMFGRARTTINPVDINAASTLVTSGVYRYTRNPMYLSLTCLLTALACGLSNAWAFSGPVLFALFITRFQIIPEEGVMYVKFGDAYTAYTARVRRWL